MDRGGSNRPPLWDLHPPLVRWNYHAEPADKSAAALTDIFTAANFAIAHISAHIGYLAFECLRKKL
jgi:hypothetical protein